MLGVDDGPFQKGQSHPVTMVAVMMEGCDIVEGVALDAFPVDGADATGYLADWIGRLRFKPSLQGVVLGGITLAGLAVVDVRELARRLGSCVAVVTRREPLDAPLIQALETAGLAERIPIVLRSPRAVRVEEGLYLASAGAEASVVAKLVRATLGKARIPEPLRVAHLVARAIVTGQSRGRA